MGSMSTRNEQSKMAKDSNPTTREGTARESLQLETRATCPRGLCLLSSCSFTSCFLRGREKFQSLQGVDPTHGVAAGPSLSALSSGTARRAAPTHIRFDDDDDVNQDGRNSQGKDQQITTTESGGAVAEQAASNDTATGSEGVAQDEAAAAAPPAKRAKKAATSAAAREKTQTVVNKAVTSVSMTQETTKTSVTAPAASGGVVQEETTTAKKTVTAVSGITTVQETVTIKAGAALNIEQTAGGSDAAPSGEASVATIESPAPEVCFGVALSSSVFLSSRLFLCVSFIVSPSLFLSFHLYLLYFSSFSDLSSLFLSSVPDICFLSHSLYVCLSPLFLPDMLSHTSAGRRLSFPCTQSLILSPIYPLTRCLNTASQLEL